MDSVTLPIASQPLPPAGPVPLPRLWEQVLEVPFFRGLLRAFEAHFFGMLRLPQPVLDLGCGDGQFAARAFPRPPEVGLDPWWPPLRETQRWNAYRYGAVCADGAAMPFPTDAFAAVVSNSVLEHIFHLDAVLAETARVLRPGGWLAFSVPNHRFDAYLSLALVAERLGLRPLARGYRGWFQRVSRHVHCDPPQVWLPRLERHGFRVRVWWHYFPRPALWALEWGHYLGLPSLVAKKLAGRWVLVSKRWNLAPVVAWLARYLRQAVDPEGAYTFYIAQRV